MGRSRASSSSSTIVRAMGLFSGVKIVTILCSLLRNKIIAWLIGPAGIGLVSLFNSITELVGTTTRLSIDQSVQRDISQSGQSDNTLTINVVRRWAVILGLLGGAVMCALSPLLSLWSFDSVERWPTFCLLGVVPLTVTIANCSIAVNQGLRRLGAVAGGTITGSLAGLAVSIPLIAWLRLESIVWVTVAYGVFTLAGAWIFRVRVPSMRISRRVMIIEGRSFLKLGANITLALFITQTLAYGFLLFLNNYATTDVLGTYQAGYTLVNTYVGVILTGIWIEYYPRLASMAHSARRLAIAVSHETSVTLIALIPILASFIALADPIIRIVYSADFLSVLPFVGIAAVGVVLRATSWCLAYVILARGDGRTYLVTETLSSAIGLGLNIAGFYYGGFTGLGISYVAWYAFYTVIVAVACYRRYRITLSAPAVRLITVALFLLTATLLLTYLSGPVPPLIIALVSAIIAIRRLRP